MIDRRLALAALTGILVVTRMALQKLAAQHVESQGVVWIATLRVCALIAKRQFLAQVTNAQAFVGAS